MTSPFVSYSGYTYLLDECLFFIGAEDLDMGLDQFMHLATLLVEVFEQFEFAR